MCPRSALLPTAPNPPNPPTTSFAVAAITACQGGAISSSTIKNVFEAESHYKRFVPSPTAYSPKPLKPKSTVSIPEGTFKSEWQLIEERAATEAVRAWSRLERPLVTLCNCVCV